MLLYFLLTLIWCCLASSMVLRAQQWASCRRCSLLWCSLCISANTTYQQRWKHGSSKADVFPFGLTRQMTRCWRECDKIWCTWWLESCFFFILLPECLCFGNPKWQHFIQTARCGRFSVNQSSLSNVLFYMCTSRELCDKYNCISCGCFTIKAIQSFPSWTLTV